MAEQPKLLIVDDDPHIRRLLKLYLRSTPYEIFEAATGEQALDMTNKTDYEVIILDLILPHYGGFRLCQRFKSKRKAVTPYVIIITGDDSPESRKSASECGADEFMSKPFAAAELVEMVQKRTREPNNPK